MKYMGSKRRFVKDLLPIMLESRKEGQYWVEPFVGDANMIQHVNGNRIGSDVHEYLIALLSAVRDGWKPPTDVSEEMHRDVRINKDKYPPELVGFVGFCCSFGGDWFKGYARNKRGENYALNGYNNLLKQAPFLKGIDFRCCSYQDLVIPPRSLIYCDPPYDGFTKYRDKLNHPIFWQWCRDKVNEGHTVFVSENKAPDDFICIKEVQRKTHLNNINSSSVSSMERIFVYKQ